MATVFLLLYAGAVLTGTGQALDAISLGVSGAMGISHDLVLSVSGLRTGLTFALLTLAALASVHVLGQRRWPRVVRAGLLLVGTGIGSEVLKDAFPRPYLGDFAYPDNSYPSVHAALSIAAVVAIVWLAPRWLRSWLVVVLGVVAMFVGAASWLSLAHRGSDVLGGALLAAALGFAIAATDPSQEGAGFPRSRSWIRSAVVISAISVASLSLALVVTGATLVPLLGVATLTGLYGVLVTLLVQQRAPSSRPQIAMTAPENPPTS